jgi:RND superfamily putative drug exporter
MLVPSLMHRFGNANWFFPAWLDKITPRLSVEPPEARTTTSADETPPRRPPHEYTDV